MTRFVVLDSSPWALLSISPREPAARVCEEWLTKFIVAGTPVVVPEIVDYEVRRELLRLEKTNALRQLDALLAGPGVNYLPITTRAMRLAAQLWAEVRRSGRPTADRHALDADVILAAQARLLADDGHDVIVATTNIRHLGLFIPAAEWWTIVAED